MVEPSKVAGRGRNTTLGRFVAQRSGLFGVALLLALLFGAGAGGRLWRYHYDDITAQYSSAPSSQHPMGTDTIGHDVLAQVLRGLQKSMEVAVVAALVSTAAGVVIGGVGGYFGGVAEGLLMRLADVALIIPGIAALAVLAASVQDVPGNWLLIALILSALLWARTARIVRAAVASLREEAFVEAARACGAGPGRIIARHILPGTAGLVITAATLTLATAVQAEAAMTFLGLGITLPDTSLGRLVAVGAQSATTRPWLFYFPGLMIVVVVVATNFVGDALRRALDRRADVGSALGP
ncbi:MAG TPA: ABC transporter permease [Acidimicrobiales bacterium]|nr:ABC transporter permease [Acidimicrobiales bacterium]